MSKKLTLLKTTLAAVLLSSATVSAIPTGGGLYDRYHGSAMFDNGNGSSGFSVSSPTLSGCIIKYNNEYNARVADGMTVTETRTCRLGKYKAFHDREYARIETEFNISEYKEKVEEIKLRKQVEAEIEIERLQKEYRIDEFRAAVAAESGK